MICSVPELGLFYQCYSNGVFKIIARYSDLREMTSPALSQESKQGKSQEDSTAT